MNYKTEIDFYFGNPNHNGYIYANGQQNKSHNYKIYANVPSSTSALTAPYGPENFASQQQNASRPASFSAELLTGADLLSIGLSSNSCDSRSSGSSSSSNNMSETFSEYQYNDPSFSGIDSFSSYSSPCDSSPFIDAKEKQEELGNASHDNMYKMGLDLIPMQACRPATTQDARTASASEAFASGSSFDQTILAYNLVSSNPSTNCSETSSPLLQYTNFHAPISSLTNITNPSPQLQSQPFSQPQPQSHSHSHKIKRDSDSSHQLQHRDFKSPRLGSCKSSKMRSKICTICNKLITRDMSRHLRIHEPVARFHCVYPRNCCSHRTGQFNRPYDFKKHLLNAHFIFENSTAKKLHNLNEKLDHSGSCICGKIFTAVDWLDNHIISGECPHLNSLYSANSQMSFPN